MHRLLRRLALDHLPRVRAVRFIGAVAASLSHAKCSGLHQPGRMSYVVCVVGKDEGLAVLPSAAVGHDAVVSRGPGARPSMRAAATRRTRGAASCAPFNSRHLLHGGPWHRVPSPLRRSASECGGTHDEVSVSLSAAPRSASCCFATSIAGVIARQDPGVRVLHHASVTATTYDIRIEEKPSKLAGLVWGGLPIGVRESGGCSRASFPLADSERLGVVS